MEEKHTIGIFSRSDKPDYVWLMKLLTSRDLSDRVAGVRSSFISNGGFVQFIDDVSLCTFGILYHTKNRGRINITDIEAALYTDELQTMRDLLGRENVVVMVDDLEDSGDQEKSRILQSQTSIKAKARDLVLISKTEKNNPKTLVTKLKKMIPHAAAAVEEETKNGHKGSNTKLKKKDSNKWGSKKKNKVLSRQEISLPCPYDDSKIQIYINQSIAWNTGGYQEKKGFQTGTYYENMTSDISTNNSDSENIYEDPNTLNYPDGYEEQTRFKELEKSNILDLPKTHNRSEHWIWNIYDSSPRYINTAKEMEDHHEAPKSFIHKSSDMRDKPVTPETSHISLVSELSKALLYRKTPETRHGDNSTSSKSGISTRFSYHNSESDSESRPTHSNGNSILRSDVTLKRKTNNPNPKKWLNNENDGTWYHRESPEKLSADYSPVVQPKNENPRTQKVDFTNRNPESRPNKNPMKWHYNASDRTWCRTESSEESAIAVRADSDHRSRNPGMLSNGRSSPESRLSKSSKWFYNEQDKTWYKT